jgi:hypothetical protein
MIKFGEKSIDIFDIKKNFITDNKKLFKWQKNSTRFIDCNLKENFR